MGQTACAGEGLDTLSGDLWSLFSMTRWSVELIIFHMATEEGATLPESWKGLIDCNVTIDVGYKCSYLGSRLGWPSENDCVLALGFNVFVLLALALLTLRVPRGWVTAKVFTFFKFAQDLFPDSGVLQGTASRDYMRQR